RRVHPRERPVPPVARRPARPGDHLRQARELLRRLQGRRPPLPVLGQIQLQSYVGRQVMSVKSSSICSIALAAFGLSASAQAPADYQSALDAAHAKYKDLKQGKNADYIPALAKVDSNIYGIALVTTDGKVYTAGDIKSEV